MIEILRQLIASLISIMLLAIFGRVIISWLLVAGLRADFIYRLDYALGVFTEPFMRPLRRFIPPIGGMIDLTPMIAIILLMVIRAFVVA